MEGKALFLVALCMAYLTPGPDMLLLLHTAARHGRSPALVAAIGLGIARAAHVALAALGLATLFRLAPWTFEAVRMVGAAYLLWLGLRMLRPGGLEGLGGEHGTPSALSRGVALRRGLFTNLLNPKAPLFCSVLLPQFITPGAGSVALQFLELGALLVAIGLLFDVLYASAGSGISQLVQRNRAAQRMQQWLFGGLLIGFAVRLAFIQQG